MREDSMKYNEQLAEVLPTKMEEMENWKSQIVISNKEKS